MSSDRILWRARGVRLLKPITRRSSQKNFIPLSVRQERLTITVWTFFFFFWLNYCMNLSYENKTLTIFFFFFNLGVSQIPGEAQTNSQGEMQSTDRLSLQVFKWALKHRPISVWMTWMDSSPPPGVEPVNMTIGSQNPYQPDYLVLSVNHIHELSNSTLWYPIAYIRTYNKTVFFSIWYDPKIIYS